MDDLEYLLYKKMCSSCPSQKQCHEECEHCESYLEVLEEQGEENERA